MEEAKAKDATPSSTAGPSGGSSSGLTGAIVGTIMSNIHARVNRLSEPELNQEHLQQVKLTATLVSSHGFIHMQCCIVCIVMILF